MKLKSDYIPTRHSRMILNGNLRDSRVKLMLEEVPRPKIKGSHYFKGTSCAKFI